MYLKYMTIIIYPIKMQSKEYVYKLPPWVFENEVTCNCILGPRFYFVSLAGGTQISFII